MTASLLGSSAGTVGARHGPIVAQFFRARLAPAAARDQNYLFKAR